MEIKEKLGSLVQWNNELHIYEIADTNQEALDEFIMKNTSREISTLNALTGEFITTYEPILKIENEADNKLVWKLRRNLNAKKKEIDTKRKQAVAIMINNFVDYCKGLSSQLDSASKMLTKMLNDYKPKKVEEQETTEKVVSITITTTNAELVGKIIELAKDNGAVWDIKEE